MTLDLDTGNFHTYCKMKNWTKLNPVISLATTIHIEVMDVCLPTFI